MTRDAVGDAAPSWFNKPWTQVTKGGRSSCRQGRKRSLYVPVPACGEVPVETPVVEASAAGHGPPMLPGLHIRQPWWNAKPPSTPPGSRAGTARLGIARTGDPAESQTSRAGTARSSTAGGSKRTGSQQSPRSTGAEWRTGTSRVDEILNSLSRDDIEEASITLPQLGGLDGLILRGRLGELGEALLSDSRQISTGLTGKHRYQMAQEHVKLEQGVWRRNHDALVRRKKLNSSGSESSLSQRTEIKRRSCLKKGGMQFAVSDEDANSDNDYDDGSDSDIDKSDMERAPTMISISRPSIDANARTICQGCPRNDPQGSSSMLDAGGIVRRSVQFYQSNVGDSDDLDKHDAVLDSAICGVCSASFRDYAMFCDTCGTRRQFQFNDGDNPFKESKRRRSRIVHAADLKLKPQKDGDTRGSQDSRKILRAQDSSSVRKSADSLTVEHSDSSLPVPTPDLPASASTSKSARPTQSKTIDFGDSLSVLSQRHGLPIHEVRRRQDEFHSCGRSGNGDLTQQEFEKSVRQRANIPENDPIPMHLTLKKCGGELPDAVAYKSNLVSFEEFLLWSINTSYAEEIMVTDLKERHIRSLARKNCFNLTDVECTKDVFNRFDADHSGTISESEFVPILIALMKIKEPQHIPPKRLHRYWSEVDKCGRGEINFEEFLLWYFKFFDSAGKPRQYMS